MPSRAHIQYKGDPKTLKKHLRPEVKIVLQEIVSEWHDKTLPDHFAETGRRRYRYRSRSRKYRDKKRKLKGHQNPLVFSGDLRRQALRRAQISGTSRSAKAAMHVPWYATRRFSSYDTYADEITAVTLTESRTMAKGMRKRLTDRLNKINKKSKR